MLMVILKNKIKQIARFILHNVPSKKVNIQFVNLSPNELLKDRAALITGGTSGIGFHIAKAFLHSGASVIITSRSEDRLEQSCTKLREGGLYDNRVLGIVMDNTRTDIFEKCFNEALVGLRNLKGVNVIDILVNNAGVLGASIPNATESEFDKVINTNLKGVFFLSQLFGKYLKANKIEGNILNIGSSSCLRPASSAYTISKWGIRGFTLGLAKSLAPYGITVNGIAPGPTATPMLLKDDINNIANRTNPIGRYALPEEIANMAVILVSPIGKTIVGDMIYMTGGAGLITFDDIDYLF